jgi:outer membrane murein-binding lipoprotein Lpp
MATQEEQLKAEIAKLRERLKKQAKQKRAAKNEWKPSFPGQHRGY